jgi:dipeptidase
MRERLTTFFFGTLFLLSLLVNQKSAFACKLFAATGDVTADSITILAKDRDLYSRREQRIWYSPREYHSAEDTIHFRHISIPQCSLTYKFIATNSIAESQTTGYGVNEYGLAIISHDMDSWDDDSLGAEYFHDQDYVALMLARCKNTSEAIDLFDDLILPHGINAETYLIADINNLWLLETTGFNYVAKPIVDDVVSSLYKKFNIRTEWSDPGNRHNENLLANAQAHGCDTTSFDFADCFGNQPPGTCDPDLLALKDRGDIAVEDMMGLVSSKAGSGTVSACVIPIRPDKDAAYFSCMWDSRANPKYENVFLPYWIAITDTALPEHYTTWPPDDPDCAWSIFSEIAEDSTLREIARPIWQALQAELFAEFDLVEDTMQTYLDSHNFSALQEYINGYVYGELDSAYHLALDIMGMAGVPEKIHEVTIALAGENLILTWSEVTVDTLGSPLAVDFYRIYRNTSAFFGISASPLDSTAELFYMDTSGVVGDYEAHYYYRVTALSGGKESGYSKRVGEFDQPLMRTK